MNLLTHWYRVKTKLSKSATIVHFEKPFPQNRIAGLLSFALKLKLSKVLPPFVRKLQVDKMHWLSGWLENVKCLDSLTTPDFHAHVKQEIIS